MCTHILCINVYIQSHRGIHMYIYRLQIPHHRRMPVDHKRALLNSFAGFGNLLSKQSRVWAALPSTCVLLLPGRDTGIGHGCPAQLPQPIKWHNSHAGWSQKNTAESKRWLSSRLERGSVWIQASMPNPVVFLCVSGCRGMCYQRPPEPAKAKPPRQTGLGMDLFHRDHPMFELVTLGDSNCLTFREKPALIWKHHMWKITARRPPAGGAAMSAHVNSKMVTFLFNSFNLTILHVSMWHSPLQPQTWYCLQGLRVPGFTLGRCWAGEGICSVTFDVRHSPG